MANHPPKTTATSPTRCPGRGPERGQDRGQDRVTTRAFRAAAFLLEQLAYPELDTAAADDLASSELSIAVTLLSGELFEGARAPGIG